MPKNKISLFSGVMLALSSLIGSGWLFGSGTAAKVAGPAAIISWVIGAAIMILIAFNYVELGTMFPESGGMSRFAQYSHGPLLGFLAAWANWVSLITLIPIEAVACVQYMAGWPWKWANWTANFMHDGAITTEGLLVVYVFMLVFTLINFWSVKVLTRFTSLVGAFKLVIPTLTIVTLIVVGFHPGNFGHSTATFMPNGPRGIFEAVTVSGIILSYDAFQTVINMAGEMVNPQKNIFRGVWISLTITAVIYIALQVAFIGAVDPTTLAKVGWQGINFSSPFADLAILLGLTWLSILLYMDAFVSPFGTGVTFVATSARTLAAMTRNGNIPAWLGCLNRRYMIPRFAMVADLVLAMVLVFFFRDWSKLATVVSVSTFVAYATGPVTAVSLRKMRPNFTRPFNSKALSWVAPLSFVLTSMVIYWAMWPTTVEVIFVVVLGLPIYAYYQVKYDHVPLRTQLKGSLWMLFYLVALSVLSYVGSKGFGGTGLIEYPYDFVVITILSLIVYRWAIASRIDGPDLKEAAKVNEDVVIDEQ
ncbi:APC family permease [Limosilactobacillus fermentum]|uniref:APC family permease n=1 Tax=Limosilactobacillus fermentum TaxID=1613 RepID=UPI0034636040